MFKYLSTFNLSSNRIGPDGAIAIAGALQNVPSLATLNLSSNRLAPMAQKRLQAHSRMFRLSLHLICITTVLLSAGAIAIAGALRRSVSHIILSSNRIDSTGAEAIANALENVSIDLHYNIILSAGALRRCGVFRLSLHSF